LKQFDKYQLIFPELSATASLTDLCFLSKLHPLLAKKDEIVSGEHFDYFILTSV